MGKKPLVLAILDGFGNNSESYGNAVFKAKTKNLDYIFKNNPTVEISASGEAVGLPSGQMGNSEVGHTNIGAGRVVYQDLARITKAISDGSFFENEVLLKAIENCKKNGTALHLMGLLSDGGVHSHINHLYGMVSMAKIHGLDRVYIHAFTDGRDVSPKSGAGFIEECCKKLKEIGLGEIVTVSGRYYAMDRDNRWDRVEKAYLAIVCGLGRSATSAKEAVQLAYDEGKTDEFIVPTVCKKNANVKDGDSVIFFNFRPDRARELTKSFMADSFDGFARKDGGLDVFFVCLTSYDEEFKDVEVAFKPLPLNNTFGEYISGKGLSQLRIAETEKYAHVTFFFNGGREEKFDGEDRILVKSPNVSTYDLKPEMSAYIVTERVVLAIESLKYDVIVLNFANCDMVGHTGDFDAAVRAVEVVDECLQKVVDATLKASGVILITADHGNAEKMLDENGAVFTAHTTNRVNFSVVGMDCSLRSCGKLSDIAPTMLQILGLEKPKEMDGESLIV